MDEIKIRHVEEAYDILLDEHKGDGAAAMAALESVLRNRGWDKIPYLDTFIKVHEKRIAQGRTHRASRTEASSIAIQLVTEAGVAITPAAPAPAAETAPAAELEPTVEVAAEPAAETPPGKAKAIVFDDKFRASIDLVLCIVTNNQLISLKELEDALDSLKTLRGQVQNAADLAQRKLDLLRSGAINDALAIADPKIPDHQSPRMIGLRTGGPTVVGLDKMIEEATAGAATSLNDVIKTIEDDDAAVRQDIDALRQLLSEIRLTISQHHGSTRSGSDPAEDGSIENGKIVYRLASSIFTDAYGTSSPLLDFEIPTIVWDTPHPDVPAIDPTYRFYAPVLADVLDCIADNRIPWVYGESGSGKSELFEQIAARLGFPFHRLNLDLGVTRSDLIGRAILVASTQGLPLTSFAEGILPRALRTPSILLLDEIDCGDENLMPVLQPVLEGRGLRLLEDGGRAVKPHPFCRIGCTANTIGLGSMNQMYLNVREQSGATRNRIAKWIEMPYLPPDKELEVVLARHPQADQGFVDRVIKLAGKVREAYRMGEVHYVMSTRTVLEAARRHARFLPLYGDETLAAMSTLDIVVLNAADARSRSVIRGLIDNIFA